jgi:hypothetical protein
MKPNIGTADRIARIIFGLVLIAYAIPLGFAHTGWNFIGWIGIIPIVTALVRFCPAYTFLGVNTCEAPTKSSEGGVQ